MRVRKLFLLGLVLVTALALVDAYAGSPTAGWGWDSFISLERPQVMTGGPRAEVSGVVEAPMATGDLLSIANARGNVQVTGRAREGLEAHYTITVFAEDEATAARYAGELEVVAVRTGERLQLELVQPDERPPGLQGVSVDYQIAVPEAVRVQLENGFGQVEVAGVAGPSTVENGYGETVLRNVAGDWTLGIRFADFRAEQVHGPLDLSSTYGRGLIQNVAGPVSGSLAYGSLTVQEAASVDLKTSYSQLELDRIGGPIQLSLAFGWAEIEGLRHELRAKGAYSDLALAVDPAASGFRLNLESRGGEIRNRMVALQGQAAVRSGGTSHLEAVVGDGAHLVQVSVQNGHVTLR